MSARTAALLLLLSLLGSLAAGDPEPQPKAFPRGPKGRRVVSKDGREEREFSPLTCTK